MSSSPSPNVPLEVQLKLQVMEDKIAKYQGLEAKVEHLTQILETLLGKTPNTVAQMEYTATLRGLSDLRQATKQGKTTHIPPAPPKPPPPLASPPVPAPPPPRPLPTTPPQMSENQLVTMAIPDVHSPPQHSCDPAIYNNKDTVFDDWKLVEKKGKRTAKIFTQSHSKRLDQRDTLTRPKT
jgi:hypothetical protein